jgi:DNA-binding NtrC family response regulator
MSQSEPEGAPRARVLVVDDDRTFVHEMTTVLGGAFELAAAHDTAGALEQVAAFRPDVVLLDITLDDGVDGFAALARIRALDAAPEVIMLTGMTGTAAVVKAIKGGAFHYMMKESNPGELVHLIGLAAEKLAADRRLASLEEQVKRLGGALVVHDAQMVKVMQNVEKVGPSSTTVLIVGESGTGKEMIARRVHELSARAQAPFVTVNCGAVLEPHLEAELFGHVKGAFAGANADRAGSLARAQGGTLFLDAVDKAPLSLQTRLLPVLESREYLRVGSPEPVKLDARIVAAASCDLDLMCAEGRFLKELLYALNVFTVLLPPLRKRPDDILPLAEHFLATFAAQTGRSGMGFSPAARQFLLKHDWRGNIRDLRNRVERAVILTTSEDIGVEALMSTRFDQGANLTEYSVAMDAAELEYLSRLMKDCDWNITKGAKVAGLTREGLSRMIAKWGLKEGKL